MPELPEMQALAERLAEHIQGKTLRRVEPLQFSALKTVEPGPQELFGKQVSEVGRRGKYVWMDFAAPASSKRSGDAERSGGESGPRLMFHLSQGGRVDIEDPAKTTRPKGSVVRFVFAGSQRSGGVSGPAVLIKEYGTDRKAGWWVLAAGDGGPLVKLGPEPDSAEFAELIRSGEDNRRIHTMLRDQKTVAGLGRGYTDDALHHAKLSPYASLKSIDPKQRERLLESIAAVLADGLKHERQRSGGLPTKVGDHWRVHNKYGQPCPVCESDLRRVSYESHEVTYCPTCQTGGKVLADRRMSRLIR